MGNVYTVNEILVGALNDRPDPDRNIILYVDQATGKASLSNGTTWNDFGGASLPGVTPDGLNPPGISVTGNAPGKEIEYAERTSGFSVDDATSPQPIPGLSITTTIAAGVKYCIEFFAYAVDENSGSTEGERIMVVMLDGETTIAKGIVVQVTGGYGGALWFMSSTKTGDGLQHTFSASVANLTAGADGAIIQGNAQSPAYIRFVHL